MNNDPTFILASTSSIRKKILDNAGLHYLAIKPHSDEPRADDNSDLTEYLHLCANTKAKAISESYHDIPVFGCDQVVYFENKILNKVSSIEEALDRLMTFSGKTHELVNGLSLCINGVEKKFITQSVKIYVRNLDQKTILNYLNKEKPLSSVACYFLEGEGIQLIKKIEGDFFSALGLPLLALLDLIEITKSKEAKIS